jgi:hypothetical protein
VVGRPEATRAALIPMSKSEDWWSLMHDERWALMKAHGAHLDIGLEYIPQVTRCVCVCVSRSDRHEAGITEPHNCVLCMIQAAVPRARIGRGHGLRLRDLVSVRSRVWVGWVARSLVSSSTAPVHLLVVPCQPGLKDTMHPWVLPIYRFEFPADQEERFDQLVQRLRETEEWEKFVTHEVDIRLTRVD